MREAPERRARADGSRGPLKNWMLVALVVVMVNLPLVHSSWQDHRLDQDGVAVAGHLTEHRADPADTGKGVVSFQVAEGGGQPGFSGEAQLTPAAYDDAVSSGRVRVRVLPGSRTVWRVEGETSSNLGLVITVVADLSLLVLVLLLVRFGSRLRREMVIVATEDLERCPPGSVLDQVDGLRFVVCGEVETIGDDEVVLDLGDRRVRVILDGHRNPAGYQQPVRATGTMRV